MESVGGVCRAVLAGLGNAIGSAREGSPYRNAEARVGCDRMADIMTAATRKHVMVLLTERRDEVLATLDVLHGHGAQAVIAGVVADIIAECSAAQ